LEAVYEFLVFGKRALDGFEGQKALVKMNHLKFSRSNRSQDQVGFPEFAKDMGLAVVPFGLGAGAYFQGEGLGKNDGTKNGQTS
jgi:hypothetical protein